MTGAFAASSRVALAPSPSPLTASVGPGLTLGLPFCTEDVPEWADVSPLLADSAHHPRQPLLVALPAVQQDIMQATRYLPAQSVGPGQIAVASARVDECPLVQSSQNLVRGGGISQAQHTIILYSAWGGVSYVLTYHDTFYWNGTQVRAEKPYWTSWKAWNTQARSVDPESGHVQNWGRVSFSQGYLNLVADGPLGGLQNLSGSATM